MNNLNLKKQIPKNLLVNILSFFSTVVIGLWLTPYLLKSLGIVAYGLIPLAMFLSQYVSVILNAINMSIGRFLLISLQKEKYKEANEIFNTSLVIVTFFVLMQLLIMATILFDISYFFEIPNNLIEDAIWLFGLTFIGFSISLFRGVFATSMFTYNRLDILRTIDIVQNIVRVVTIVSLFIYDEPSLKYIGIANLLASLSAIAPTLYYFKVFTPQLKINIYLFSKKYVTKLSKMSTWILINQVGVLLLGSIDLYLVNKFIGSQATGEYSIIVQITSLLKTLSTLIAGVISPVIMIYHSNNELNKLKNILVLSSKLLAIVMIFPLAIIIGLSENIIALWLGVQYSYLHNIISFSLLFYIIAIPLMPLFNINIAYNKVKLPAIVAVTFGVLNVIGIYLFLTYTELGLWGVIIIKLLFEIFFGIFIIWYVSNIISIQIFKLLKIPLISIISFSIVYSFILLFKYLFNMDLFINIIMVSILTLVTILPILLIIFLSKEEKFILYNRKRILRKNLK